MCGAGQNSPGITALHDVAHIHDSHVISQFRHHAHVMGNKEDCRVIIILKVLHQFKYLCLYGDVQRRGGFIRNQHLGLAAHGHGDHGPLTHAP